MMNHCPKCGQKRLAEDFQCPQCHCFYSPLDEILAEEAAELERKSLKGHLKTILLADNPKQALREEIKNLRENTPRQTSIALVVIVLFVFALIVSVL